MAKVSRGGKRTTTQKLQMQQQVQEQDREQDKDQTPVPAAPVLVPPTPQQIAQGITLPTGGVDYDTFSKMSDDEKADEISKAMQAATPMFLDDSYLQKMMYYTGYNQKPDVVDDTAYANAQGKEIFRTVHDVYDRTNDINYTASDIIKQIQTGSFTQVSGSGGSAHGRAIYFADSVSDSSAYASGRNSTMMRAKIKPTAKIRSESRLGSEIMKEISSGSKLGRVLQKIGNSSDYASQIGVYCMAKGYDGWVSQGTGYHMIINRGALVTSKSVKKNVTYGTRTW